MGSNEVDHQMPVMRLATAGMAERNGGRYTGPSNGFGVFDSSMALGGRNGASRFNKQSVTLISHQVHTCTRDLRMK